MPFFPLWGCIAYLTEESVRGNRLLQLLMRVNDSHLILIFQMLLLGQRSQKRSHDSILNKKVSVLGTT